MSAPSKPRPKRRAKAVIFWFLLVLVGAYIASVLIPPPQVTLKVGPDTTFFTEPLREDGTVDLAAAINQRTRESFGTGTNAAVPLARAFDFGQSTQSTSARLVYRELGLPWPPDDVMYLSPRSYCERQGEDDDAAWALDKQLTAAMSEPWSASVRPELLAWMEANAEVTQTLSAAATSDYYFWPVVLPEKPGAMLLEAPLPRLGGIRQVAMILLASALREDSGEPSAQKWDRVLKVLRLGRLIADGKTVTERLIAAAMVQDAVGTACVLLNRNSLSNQQATSISRRLDELEPWPPMGPAFQHETRVIGISAFQSLYRKQLFGDLSDDVQIGRLAIFNVNAALRRADAWYDRIDEAFTKPSLRLQYRALAAAMFDFQTTENWREEHEGLLALKLTCAPAPVRQRIATDRLYRLWMSVTMPELSQGFLIGSEATVRATLLRTSIGLQMYFNQQSEYPESLDALVPDFLDALPIDLFSDKPLVYRRQGDGFILHSVGPNFIDDGGVTAEKAIFDNPHDIVIRIGVDNNAAEPTDMP
jgi:hypothetical protein